MKNLLNLSGAQQLSKNELQQIKGKGIAQVKSCINGATCRIGLQCCNVGNGMFRCVDPSGPQGTNCFVIDG